MWKKDNEEFFLSILFMLIVKAAFANSEYRCGVSLIFDSDGTGSVANYILSLQVKNTTGRNINGVSVIYKDKEGEVIGNAALQCSVNSSISNLEAMVNVSDHSSA